MPRIALHWQILLAMLVGAAAGTALNAWYGDRTTSVEVDERTFEMSDSPNGVVIVLDAGTADERTVQVDPTGEVEGAYPTLEELGKHEDEAYDVFAEHGMSWGRQLGGVADVLGKLFLRLLKMVSIPLIVTSLVAGVTGLGKASALGSMFTKTLAYYVCTSMLAIVTGLVFVNAIRPGVREGVVANAAVEEEVAAGGLGTVLYEQLLKCIPENPFAALASGDFLSIIAFSLAFSVFTLLAGEATTDVVRRFFVAAFETMMTMTMAIIRLAPVGVLFLMMSATASQGLEVFRSLGWYMLTVTLALLTHAVVTMPVILRFVAQRNPWKYAQAMSPALLTAFSSASSNGTLPLTMASAETRGGVDNRVSSFVLPLGATVNMDGTALYEAVAVLFIAQVEGLNLGLDQQIVVALTALLASIGAAGIPHAGLVMMVIVLQAVGLPADRVGMVIAVDRVLDMLRTSVNVWSDSCGCAVLAHLERGKGGS